jgi:hypothetical protein
MNRLDTRAFIRIKAGKTTIGTLGAPLQKNIHKKARRKKNQKIKKQYQNTINESATYRIVTNKKWNPLIF